MFLKKKIPGAEVLNMALFEGPSMDHTIQDIRLCELRLQKVQDVWETIKFEADEEKCTLEESARDGEDYAVLMALRLTSSMSTTPHWPRRRRRYSRP